MGTLLTAAVVAAVAGGMLLLDSPAAERAERLDGRRVADLAGIARAVDLYWTRHGRLPASLSELNGEPGVNISANDPTAGVPYEYRAFEATTFEVCATFERRSPADRPDEVLWSHDEGRQCFRRTARKIDSGTAESGSQTQASGPPMPFEDIGACPFEGCAYARDWIANAPVTSSLIAERTPQTLSLWTKVSPRSPEQVS